MGITHPFVSAKADGTDTSVVRPTDWNAAHTLAGEGARVYHNADQSIPDSTETVVSFNSEDYDTDTIHDPVTNNSRLTCKTAGKYLVLFWGRFATNTTGRRYSFLRKNGTDTIYPFSPATSVGQQTSVPIMAILNLAVNDYLEVLVYQNSGAGLALEYVSEQVSYFSMQRVG